MKNKFFFLIKRLSYSIIFALYSDCGCKSNTFVDNYEHFAYIFFNL